jgi:SHS2 domain-containing protein
VFRWIDHTAELELEITATTKEAVFREALAAFAELVGRDSRGEPAEHTVTVTASDAPALLVEWLGELVFLAETRDFLPEGVTALELGEKDLRATVAGRSDEPSHLVKSVTYHGLELRENGEGWLARVVLDV